MTKQAAFAAITAAVRETRITCWNSQLRTRLASRMAPIATINRAEIFRILRAVILFLLLTIPEDYRVKTIFPKFFLPSMSR